MFKIIASAAVASGFLLAGSLFAQDTPGEETFFEMNKAVAAANRCNGADFTQAQNNTLQTHIAKAAGEPIGAGRRLKLIYDAKARIHKLTLAKGCSQAEVSESLALFESDLAGLL